MSIGTESAEGLSQRIFPSEETSGLRVDAREFFRLLDRRKWHLLGITAVVFAVTCLILAQVTPEYRATATVMLDTRKARVTNTSDVLGGLTADLPVIQTEIEVLRSSALLGRVVDKLRLESDPEFGAAAPGILGIVVREGRAIYMELTRHQAMDPQAQNADNSPRARAIQILSRNLTIGTSGRSYVISASMDSVDPVKAKRIIDAVTDFYIVDQLQAKLDANKRASDFFAERLDELRGNLETAERAVASFREKAGLTIGKDSTITSQSLSELNTQLVQARALRADRESRLVALKRAQSNPATLGGMTEVLANPLVSSLRAQEAEVARRIGDLAQRYGDSHPRLLQARAEQGQIQARIGAEVGKILASIASDAEAARAKEAELQALVDRVEKQAGGLGQSEVQLRQLEREAQSSRALYEDFLKRSKELREQQDLQQPDARVLSPAAIPSSPVSPRYGVILILSLIGGLVLGAGTVGVIERLDSGFRTGEQIERLTGRARVGMIPSLERSKLEGKTPAQYAVERPSSAYSESLRSAYTAIRLGTLDQAPKVIMVTSSVPDEGKSTFAASLAGLLAKSNTDKKVVLVDGDLRRSSVASTLGEETKGPTIDEYLSGTKSLEEIIGYNKQSGLYFIRAHRNTPNSAEVLDSNAMRHFVEALSAVYDIVILDTPPLMAVADARLVAKLADYVVFLVRWERTGRELAVNALKLLDFHKNVGIVLSQVNVRRHAKYGYGDYGYYYSHYKYGHYYVD